MASEDVEVFINNVDEVAVLINGLKSGTISPEYVDSKIRTTGCESKAKAQQGPAAARPCGQQNNAAAASDTQSDQVTPSSGADAETEEQRKARLMAKVQELQSNRERRLAARARYEAYCQAASPLRAARYGTDYTKWGMWCPDDEEDDLFNSLTPSGAGFRAMEKDIEDRHKRMVEQRQLAERARVAGNAAFAACQYSEALRCYQQGVETQRTSMPLHANAAQAALKLKCYVQAIEHCDKVLHIADFLHNNPRHPLCVKAHVRRAAAYQALEQHERAVQDLQEAAAIEPGNKEVILLLSKARLALEEQMKQKQVRKALASGSSLDTAGSFVSSINIPRLLRLEQLVTSLRDQATGNEAQAQGITAAAAALPDLAQTQTEIDRKGKQALGPRLPARPSKEHTAAAAAAAATGGAAGLVQGSGRKLQPPAALSPAVELQELVLQDDACRVYFRDCGGLSTSAGLVVSLAKRCVEQEPWVGQPAPKGPPASHQQPHLQTLVHLLDLLNTAAVNDGNLLQLPGQPGLLAAAAWCCTSTSQPLAAAATRLLCTSVTAADVRKAVSTHLAAPHLLPALLARLGTALPSQQALLLTLLGNCSVDEVCRQCWRAVLQQGDTVAAPTQPAPCPPALATLVSLLSSPTAAVAEHAMQLVSNLCGSAQLRAALAAQQSVVAAIMRALVAAGGKPGVGAQTQPRPPPSMCLAAATALYNLALEPAAQASVASSSQVLALLQLLQAPDACIVARVAGSLARCCKHGHMAEQLVQQGGVQALCDLVRTTVRAREGTAPDRSIPGCDSEGRDEAAALDAATRALTILVSPEAGAAGGAEAAVAAVLAADGLVTMQAVLTLSADSQSAIGNAALCVANCLKLPAAMLAAGRIAQNPATGEDAEPLDVPSQAEAKSCLVAALVRAAYMGQGGATSKNAAIALARLAQDVRMLGRLKELRGLEVIHAHTKL
ncbi:hypothetical protein V8C86DRAFT_3128274 [Haematococcus lacustris]